MFNRAPQSNQCTTRFFSLSVFFRIFLRVHMLWILFTKSHCLFNAHFDTFLRLVCQCLKLCIFSAKIVKENIRTFWAGGGAPKAKYWQSISWKEMKRCSEKNTLIWFFTIILCARRLLLFFFFFLLVSSLRRPIFEITVSMAICVAHTETIRYSLTVWFGMKEKEKTNNMFSLN